MKDNVAIFITHVQSEALAVLAERYAIPFSLRDEKIERPSFQLRRQVSLILARHALATQFDFAHNKSCLVKIERTSSGLPFLQVLEKDTGGQALPSLSISHSGPWIGCLLGPSQRKVGLDMEDMTRRRSYQKIADYSFTLKEASYVRQYGQQVFYAIWTAKEALAKASGWRLADVLKRDLSKYFGQVQWPLAAIVDVDGVPFSLYQEEDSNKHLFVTCAVEGKKSSDVMDRAVPNVTLIC